MNGRRSNRQPNEPARKKTSMPVKDNGGRKSASPGRVEGLDKTSVAPVKRTPLDKARKAPTTKHYMESQRRNLVKKSPVPHVDREFWMHVYAEVSAFRYPEFLHQLNKRSIEAEAVQTLWSLCQHLLTKEERREACRTRLQRKSDRGEIKIYSEEELIP